jgi:hypothetical protein
MQKIIRIKEIKRQQERIKKVRELMGASAVECKEEKIKALFEMFHRT